MSLSVPIDQSMVMYLKVRKKRRRNGASSTENESKKRALQGNFNPQKKKKKIKVELDNTCKKNDCIKLKENDEISKELREKRRGLCRCIDCKIVRLQIKNHTRKYHCPLFLGCTSLFKDRLDFIEHQLSEHGAIYDNSHCQEHEECLDPLSLPPITVYMVQQFWTPWVEPNRWTMNELEQEKKRVESELSSKNTCNHKPRQHLVLKGFREAYAKVYKYGQEEIDDQFLKALFYYDSTLPYSSSSSLDLDQTASIGNGKNWLSGQVKKVFPKKKVSKFSKDPVISKCFNKQIDTQKKNDRNFKVEEDVLIKADSPSSSSSSSESSSGETSNDDKEDKEDEEANKDDLKGKESKSIFSQLE